MSIRDYAVAVSLGQKRNVKINVWKWHHTPWDCYPHLWEPKISL